MNKYIYLFELDSVRNTDREIEIGQRALYEEIVENGNIVVLTYNQLIDSRGFFSLLGNKEYYEDIISLFESGSICISQYDDIRTISQYLINSLNYEKKFIYSGWPLKSTQKRLLALIKRSLIYSDLSEISAYITGKRDEYEVKDLFVEVVDNKTWETTLSFEQCNKILSNLYGMLKTVLRLSSIHTIYIYPKDKEQYEKLKLYNILEFVLNFNSNGNNNWTEAVNIIHSLPHYLSKSNVRSYYHQDIFDLFEKDNTTDKTSYQYAEAIIDLCYNYACEISICNISKHYNLDELIQNQSEKRTFENDFFSRLAQYWNLGDLDNRFLVEESNKFEQFSSKKIVKYYKRAARIINYTKKEYSNTTNDIYRYEYKMFNQKRRWKGHVIAALAKQLLSFFVCILIAIGIEGVFNFSQNLFDETVNFNTPLWYSIETILFLLISEVVTTAISKIIPWFLSFSDALSSFFKTFADTICILNSKINNYYNECEDNLEVTENYCQGNFIEFVKSDAMKRYLSFKVKKDQNRLFDDSKIYPLAEAENKEVLKELSRTEELYNYQYGIVYKSKFNTLCVDPIVSKIKCGVSYFPYERIIPSTGNGVVMVTICEGKFILLKQYRHALRRLQLGFPRGYGETGISSKENAIKELKEEINADIKEQPKRLGAISQDSGLTSSCVDVYLVEIENYSLKAGYEGIIDVVALSDFEFKCQIENNMKCKDILFDDGFTLAAYLLYKQNKEQMQKE